MQTTRAHLKPDISNNFRSNLSNKLQTNEIPERRKTLILRAPPQIFIEAKWTSHSNSFRCHYVKSAKQKEVTNLRAKYFRVPPA